MQAVSNENAKPEQSLFPYTVWIKGVDYRIETKVNIKFILPKYSSTIYISWGLSRTSTITTKKNDKIGKLLISIKKKFNFKLEKVNGNLQAKVNKTHIS